MRAIGPNEHCLSATEIADRFTEIYCVEIHPTNVGNAAKKLDIDYIEVEVESGSRWTTIQRRYGEEDIPAIFAILSELVSVGKALNTISRTRHGFTSTTYCFTRPIDRIGRRFAKSAHRPYVARYIRPIM